MERVSLKGRHCFCSRVTVEKFSEGKTLLMEKMLLKIDFQDVVFVQECSFFHDGLSRKIHCICVYNILETHIKLFIYDIDIRETYC